MSYEEHQKRHKMLHGMLYELIADFIGHTGELPSKTTVVELMRWSYEQTICPGWPPAKKNGGMGHGHPGKG